MNGSRRHVGDLGVLCALLFGLLTPGHTDAQEAGAPSTTALATARKLVEAFNDHDPAAMASLVTADFELYYMSDGGLAELAVEGREQLALEMTSYFETRSSVRSEITGFVDGPTIVSFREQIVGGQSSLAVYEVRDGLILRAWYYPAED